MINDLVPLSYEKDGVQAGVFVDYFNLISEKSGLEFIIDMSTATVDVEEQMDGILEENFLMLRPRRTLECYHGKENIITSNTVFETELAYVARKDNAYNLGKQDLTFALTRQTKYLENMLLADSDEFKINYYDSTEECLEAVIGYPGYLCNELYASKACLC